MPHDYLDQVIGAPAEGPDPGDDWREHLMLGSRGQTLSNLANVLLPLRYDESWQGVVGYDQMREAVMVLRPLPGLPLMQMAGGGGPLPRHWTNEDDLFVQEWLQRTDFGRVGLETAANAITRVARERAYHPVRDWLDGLRHDGIPRLGGGTTAAGETVEPWLTRYLGAEDSDYSRAVGSVLLLSMVARIRLPGCKVDTAVILEGEQGVGKSSVCRILGGEWFSDGLPDIRSKDAEAHLAGKWLVEISELEAMGRADAAVLKSFMTRQVGRYRPAYARREVEQRRQCVFVGTTNEGAYLRDPTGGRRFLPLRVGAIDLEALAADRDQLLAEADALHRAGARWHITDSGVLGQAREEQEARYDGDPWENKVAHYLEGRTRVTVGDVMEDALGIQTANMDRRGQLRVMNILTSLGWRRGTREQRGRTAWRAPGW